MRFSMLQLVVEPLRHAMRNADRRQIRMLHTSIFSLCLVETRKIHVVIFPKTQGARGAHETLACSGHSFWTS